MEGEKVEKLQNEVRTFFFFFFFFAFRFSKPQKLVMGLLKWKFSIGEKTFHAGKNIRKNDFAPSEKFSCYAPAHSLTQLAVTTATLHYMRRM